MRIKLRAYLEEGQEPCFLVPIEMSPRSNTTRLDGDRAIVNCVVLSGDEHMMTMGFSVGRFNSMPILELELIEEPKLPWLRDARNHWSAIAGKNTLAVWKTPSGEYTWEVWDGGSPSPDEPDFVDTAVGLGEAQEAALRCAKEQGLLP